MFRHPAIKLLLRGIQRECNTQLALAMVPVVVGVVLFVWCRNWGAWVSVVSLSLWLMGLLLLKKILPQSHAETHALWQTLMHHPLRIVWVYTVRTQVMPFGLYLWETGQIYFNLVDGTTFCIYVPPRKLLMLSKFLNKLLPHATFGFSYDHEKLFRENPAQLVKSSTTLT